VTTEGPRRSMRLSDDEIWEFVGAAHTGVMTTLRRDGMPISLPVWFAVVDRVIYVRTRGRKLQRIANDPRTAFLVESGLRWGELKAVHFTGRTKLVEPAPGLQARIDAEIERKYAGSRTPSSSMPAATASLYANAMRWTAFTADRRVLSWDNSKLLSPETA
jgi:hypothetical protein